MRAFKSPMFPSNALRVLAMAAVVAVISACSSANSRKNIDTMPMEPLYAKAHESLQNGDYAAATKAYERLIGRFPSSDYAQQAQLEMAYSQYKDNQPDDALSTINRFIKTYPTQQHVDYAYYLRGLINFDRSSGIMGRFLKGRDAQSRRDQGYNLQAFDDFAELSRRFPDSAYTADARQRMIYLRNVLAQYEINVAEYYLRTEAYVAAADRAQYVIEHYQQSPQAGDALAILSRSYASLDHPNLAKQAREVLELNYPSHPYLEDPKWPHKPSTLRRLVPFTDHNR